jgi:hypothetical protein
LGLCPCPLGAPPHSLPCLGKCAEALVLNEVPMLLQHPSSNDASWLLASCL